MPFSQALCKVCSDASPVKYKFHPSGNRFINKALSTTTAPAVLNGYVPFNGVRPNTCSSR